MGNFVILLLLGYVVGSISPGYFFGRTVKGIDIRKYGRLNTGATNTYYIVGPVFGIITGIIDFVKAPLIYYFAVSGLFGLSGISYNAAIFVGLASVIGHVFPFYLGFCGGRGVASLYGLNAIVLTVFTNFSVPALCLFAGTVFYSIVISQRPEVKKALGEAPVRKFLKLGGLIFPLSLLVINQSTMALVTGLCFGATLFFDILRFVSPKINERYLRLKTLAKHKEVKKPSGYTLFFMSIFVIFSLFNREVAILSTMVFIVGDVFAPFGNVFSAKKLIGEKSLGGAGLVFLMAAAAGLFLKNLALPALPVKMVISAAFSATILDQLAIKVDDNVLVPIGTALILTFLWIL